MVSAGVRKAAMLLKGLDARTAAELLRSASPEFITQVAAEMAYLEATGGLKMELATGSAREFVQQIRQQGGGPRKDGFLETMLEGVFGAEKARGVLQRMPELVEARDPFMSIRSANPADLAEALAGEPPAVVGVVLAELPAKTSTQLLPLLGEEVRAMAIRGLTGGEPVSPETCVRVAARVRKRLGPAQPAAGAGAAGAGGAETVAAPTGAAAARAEKLRREKRLRQVAILLRGLAPDLRNALVHAIAERDEETSQTVQKLMVIWEDVTMVAGRSIQDALRSVDVRKLALALVGADQAVIRKVRGNISRRLAGVIDEETSLLSDPKPEDIEGGRGEILNALRELAGGGLLKFEGD